MKKSTTFVLKPMVTWGSPNLSNSQMYTILVGGFGFTHLKKYWSMGRIIPYIMENIKCYKPPTSIYIYIYSAVRPHASFVFVWLPELWRMQRWKAFLCRNQRHVEILWNFPWRICTASVRHALSVTRICVSAWLHIGSWWLASIGEDFKSCKKGAGF